MTVQLQTLTRPMMMERVSVNPFDNENKRQPGSSQSTLRPISENRSAYSSRSLRTRASVNAARKPVGRQQSAISQTTAIERLHSVATGPWGSLSGPSTDRLREETMSDLDYIRGGRSHTVPNAKNELQVPVEPEDPVKIVAARTYFFPHMTRLPDSK